MLVTGKLLHACADAKLGLIASAIAIPEMDRAADSRAEEILDILRNWKKK